MLAALSLLLNLGSFGLPDMGTLSTGLSASGAQSGEFAATRGTVRPKRSKPSTSASSTSSPAEHRVTEPQELDACFLPAMKYAPTASLSVSADGKKVDALVVRRTLISSCRCANARGLDASGYDVKLPLALWTAVRLNGFSSWARQRRGWHEFPIKLLQYPIDFSLTPEKMWRLSSQYGIILTPTPYVLSGFEVSLDAGKMCKLLSFDSGNVGSYTDEELGTVWKHDYAIYGIRQSNDDDGEQGDASPLWNEVARRARIRSVGHRHSPSLTYFSPAALEESVLSIGIGVASADEVLERVNDHSVPSRGDGGSGSHRPARGSAGDLQYDLYRYPFPSLANRPPPKSQPYRSHNVTQYLLAVGQAFHCESNGPDGRLVTLARRDVHRSDSAWATMQFGDDVSTAAPCNWSAVGKVTPSVETLPTAYNRYAGQFYHTLSEQAIALQPLHDLLSSIDGIGSDVLVQDRHAAPILRNAGFESVPLRQAVPGTITSARVVLIHDPVVVNWPDVTALLALRERIRRMLGLPQDELSYLKHRSHGFPDGGSKGRRAVLRRRRLFEQNGRDRERALWADAQRAISSPSSSAAFDGDTPAYVYGHQLYPSAFLAPAPAHGSDRAPTRGLQAAATDAATTMITPGNGSTSTAPWPHPCPSIASESKSRPRVLLLRRRGSRKIVNFEELEAAVRATSADVTIFDDAVPLQRRTVLGMFAAADVIVAAHGAGLTNLLACRTGTVLLEVLHSKWKLWDYAHFSMSLGLRYHRFVVEGGGQNAPEMVVPVENITAVLCGALGGA